MSYIKRYLELCEDYGKQRTDDAYAMATIKFPDDVETRYKWVQRFLGVAYGTDRRFDQPQTI